MTFLILNIVWTVVAFIIAMVGFGVGWWEGRKVGLRERFKN